MAKIKIQDLPKDMQISIEEMKKVAGGYSTYFIIPLPDYLKATDIHAAARSQKKLLDSILADASSDIANSRVPL
jgi:hypothetical protein